MTRIAHLTTKEVNFFVKALRPCDLLGEGGGAGHMRGVGDVGGQPYDKC